MAPIGAQVIPVGQLRAFRLLLLLALASGLFALSAPLWDRHYAVTVAQDVINAVAGLSLVVFALIAARKPWGLRIGMLALLTSIVYFLGWLAGSSSPLLSTVGLFVAPLFGPVGLHLIVAFPEGRVRPGLERFAISFAYAETLVMAQVASLMTWDPAGDQQCRRSACPSNLLLTDHDRKLFEAIVTIDRALWSIVLLLVGTVLVRRWWHATPPERRALGPVYLAFAANIGVGLAIVPASTESLLTFQDQNPFVQVLAAFTIITVAVALVIGLLRAALVHAAVGNLVVGISQSPTFEALERAIATAIGDPRARLFPWNGDAAGSETSGRDSPMLPGEPPGASVTVINGSDGPLAVLAFDPSLARHQPELVAAVSAAASLALENRRLHDEIRLIRKIPPGLAERLQREGRRIGEMESLEVTILMSDVRGYSSLAEHADPRSLANQLLEHRRAMNREIGECGGTVMQFVGDAVFAVFGAPVPLESHALRAVRASSRMQVAQRALNQEWSAGGLPPFQLGIGVTTGVVAAALLGSDEHLEYSVVGDVVNLAERLQQWADGGEVVIDAATHSAAASEIQADALPVATVKGREGEVAAYRLRRVH